MAKKVLFVDDSPSVVQAAYDELDKNGFDVEVAYDGQEALERIKEEIPDIIILDIEMPKMKGDEAAEKIRTNPETASIPIIALTACSAESLAEKSEYFDAYLIKPFGFDEMIKTIKKFIGNP
jgi:two-component system alkaline phosphatase synthesis response regulator PhoP